MQQGIKRALESTCHDENGRTVESRGAVAARGKANVARVTCLLLFAGVASTAWSAVPAPRTVDVTTPDGVILKATYYAAAQPGPAVLLLHMCNTTRQSGWDPVGRQLSAAGIHALALDYRGFGDSPGVRFDAQTPAERQKMVTDAWPGDVDAALAFLLAQPGVDKAHVGAGGGSCGVNQAVQLARRHPNVISLVLLAGPTDRTGREFLQQTRWLPVFAAAAADDQFDAQAPQSMQWLAGLSGNPRNRFVGFADGRHGTEIFGPHPELAQQIVEWYADTLVKAPADSERRHRAKEHAGEDILGGARFAGWRCPGRADVS